MLSVLPLSINAKAIIFSSITSEFDINPFMHNVVKLPFYDIMHERAKFLKRTVMIPNEPEYSEFNTKKLEKV